MTTDADSLCAIGAAMLGRARSFDLGVIDGVWSQRYAVAVDDLNRVYFDAERARACGFDGPVVPPNLVATQRTTVAPGPNEAEMQADGLARVVEADEPALLAMGGGQDLVFHAPVLVGEHVVADARIVRAEAREGRAGAMLIVEEEIAYRLASGEPRTTLVQTTLYRLLDTTEARHGR